MFKRLVNIGSKTLEVYKRGFGQPVIVIEVGMGTSMDEWSYILEKVSETATVLIYHRAGYGKSTIDLKEERTIYNIIKDLHILLEKEGISENIILVGHSFGGLCIQHYANKYSNQVKGLIMIDPTPNEYNKIESLKKQLVFINKKYNTNKMIDRWNSLAMKNQDELVKEISSQFLKNGEEDLEEKERSRLEFLSKPNLYRAMSSEFNNMIDSGKEIQHFCKFSNIPLKILIRDKVVEINKMVNNGIPNEEAKELESLIQSLIRKQVSLSSKGEIIEAKNCGHNIFDDSPELVIATINDVIKNTIK